MKDPKNPKHGIHRRKILKGAAAASLAQSFAGGLLRRGGR